VDPRLRNRGWLKFAIGVFIFAGLCAYLGLTHRSHPFRNYSQNERVIGILVYLVIAWFGIWGCIDLAKAKGHGSEIVAFIMVAGCCLCPIFYVAMPLIILFALDDRLPSRRRHRHRRHSDEEFN